MKNKKNLLKIIFGEYWKIVVITVKLLSTNFGEKYSNCTIKSIFCKIWRSVVVCTSLSLLANINIFAESSLDQSLKWLSKLVESGREYYAIDTSEMTDAEFEKFFRSQTFEKIFRNNKEGDSLSVGFDGVELKFGGYDESSDVWATWSDNREKIGWDFKSRNKKIIRVSVLNLEFIETLPRIIQAIGTFKPEPNRTNELGLHFDVDENTALLKIHWKPTISRSKDGLTMLVNSLKIKNIILNGATLPENARSEIISQMLTQEETPIRLTWDKNSSFVTVFLVSDQGHFLSAYAKRPIAREALLIMQINRGNIWKDIGEVSDIFTTTRGQGEERSSSWGNNGWPTKDRFLATVSRGVVTCGQDRRLENVLLKQIKGDGRWCEEILPRQDTETKVIRTILTWGPNATYELSAMVQQKVPDIVSEQEVVVFIGDEITVSLTKNVTEAYLTTSVEGRIFWTKVGDENGKGLKLKTRFDRQGGLISDYTYSLQNF